MTNITSGLPSWIFFDYETMRLGGTPMPTDLTNTDNNPLNVEIKCFDQNERVLSVTFQITIINNAP